MDHHQVPTIQGNPKGFLLASILARVTKLTEKMNKHSLYHVL
jgi:hypothetical protein